jgi:hypothetical protein
MGTTSFALGALRKYIAVRSEIGGKSWIWREERGTGPGIREQKLTKVRIFTGGGGVVLVLRQNLAVSGVDPLADEEGGIWIGVGFNGLGGCEETLANFGGALGGCCGAIVSSGIGVDGMKADGCGVDVHGVPLSEERAIGKPGMEWKDGRMLIQGEKGRCS